MSSAVLCIGANVEDSARNIAFAKEALKWAGCLILQESDVYQMSSPYLNYVAMVDSDYDYDTLHGLTKRIERFMGRLPEHKCQGIVPIDIDIVIFDGEIMRQADFSASYFRHGYEALSPL